VSTEQDDENLLNHLREFPFATAVEARSIRATFGQPVVLLRAVRMLLSLDAHCLGHQCGSQYQKV
jgi:hypothetical protein